VNWRIILDTKVRSLVKTISWRLTGTLLTFLISWAILGDIATSSAIAIIQLTFNTFAFYIHERIWNLSKWGRK
jgi:uncharacterized membrane protein